MTVKVSGVRQPMSADPDEELVRRVGAGDPAAVQALVARKLPRILSLAVRMLGDAAEAEDVAQETFVRIWRHASSWRRGNARFDSWIHRVTLNLCDDRLRRRREWVTDELPEWRPWPRFPTPAKSRIPGSSRPCRQSRRANARRSSWSTTRRCPT